MEATRSLTFRLYPSRAQAALMDAKHRVLKDLWNAGLEERIGAWRRGVRVGLGEQERHLKEVRAGVDGWKGLVHTHEAQTVLKRLDLAFQGFFRRIRLGQKPGFPRFRSADTFRGWGYKEHGNGFRVTMRDGWRHGHVALFGVGRMRLRGVARTPGRVLKADVTRSAGRWHLNVVVSTDCAVRAPATGPACGLDWGVSDFATLALEGGGFETVPNPRHFDSAREGLTREQRALSALARCRKVSRRALVAQRRRLARRHAKVAARRKDFLHKITAGLVALHRFIATEKLTVRNMTGSARGTAEAPGRNVAQKAGLNRSILDAAPAAFLNMLGYKAEEAGSGLREAETRRLKPSQRCPWCGEIRKKGLSLRVHDCACGCRMGRDEASATVLLDWGLEGEALSAFSFQAPGEGHPAGTVGAAAA